MLTCAMSPKRRGHGEGAVFQRGDDRWVAVVRVPGVGRRWLYGRSRAEVIRRLADFRASGVIPTRQTVGAFLLDWLTGKRSVVRSSTWMRYEGLIRLHLASLAPLRLDRLTAAHVRRLRTQLLEGGLAPRTVGHALIVLRMALNQGVRDGVLARNVAQLVDLPRRSRGEPRILSLTEARRFRSAALSDPLGGLWTTLLGTGMRLGEALGLRWGDVDLPASRVSITGSLGYLHRAFRGEGAGSQERRDPKTSHGRRRIVVPAFVAAAIDVQPRRGIYVFTTARGTPLDARNVRTRFERFLAGAGLPRITIHALRHTAASLMLAEGLELEDVRRYLGHANIATTSDIYGHLMEHRRPVVAAALERAVGQMDVRTAARPRGEGDS
jgi:integrase